MNSHDQDLGSTAPALLSNGTVLQVGKNQLAYLMNQSNLGGNTGTGIATASVCPGAIAGGGDAVLGSVVYVPCESGLQALQTSAAPASGLCALDQLLKRPRPADQRRWTDLVHRRELAVRHRSRYRRHGGQPLPWESQTNHFPSPSVGDGLLLAPTQRIRSYAFAGSAGLPGPPSPPPPAAPPNSSYWLVASDGGIFTYGNAPCSTALWGATTPEPAGRRHGGDANDASGYWLVASDGGVFTYGQRGLSRVDGWNQELNAPVVGMAASRDGGGYWLVASDGGIFAFGDAAFHGSMGGTNLNAPVVGMAATPDGEEATG